TRGDFLQYDELPTPAEFASQHLLRRDLASALDHLNERERRIIDLRYGLADGQRRTLEEVGKVLGMTRERARQIEAEALRRLRAPEVGPHLRDYLEYSTKRPTTNDERRTAATPLRPSPVVAQYL